MVYIVTLVIFLFKYCITNSLDVFGDSSYIFNWTIENETIVISIKSTALGWIGLGFSDTGVMSGSDLIICYLEPTGRPVCKDSFGDGHDIIPDTNLSGSDNIRNVEGNRDNDITTINFIRAVDTWDRFDKPIFKDTPIYVLFAYRSTGSFLNEGFKQHSRMSIKKMKLYTAETMKRVNTTVVESSSKEDVITDIGSINMTLGNETNLNNTNVTTIGNRGYFFNMNTLVLAWMICIFFI
jgi:hypothetical protein